MRKFLLFIFIWQLHTGLCLAQNTLEQDLSIKSARKEPTQAPSDKLIVNAKAVISDLYPNPANDIVYIDSQLNPGTKSAKLLVYNLLGMPAGEFELPRNEKKFEMDISHFNTGVYFYTLSIDGTKEITKRLIIRR